LLTVSAIRRTGTEVRGVVMVGRQNMDNRTAIERYGDVPVVGEIPWLESIDRRALCNAFQQHFDKAAFE
jgi:hypothetical protein